MNLNDELSNLLDWSTVRNDSRAEWCAFRPQVVFTLTRASLQRDNVAPRTVENWWNRTAKPQLVRADQCLTAMRRAVALWEMIKRCAPELYKNAWFDMRRVLP